MELYLKKVNQMEKLSDQEMEILNKEVINYVHLCWSGWIECLFSKATYHPDGSATIPKEAVDGWLHSYITLSDKEEADRILAIIASRRT